MIKTPECDLTAASIKRLRGRKLSLAVKMAKRFAVPVFVHLTAKGPVIDTTFPVRELRVELGPCFKVFPNGYQEEVL